MAKQGPGRRHTLLEKIRRGAVLDRRGMTLVFGTALVIVMILAAVIVRSSLPVKLTEADRAMLKKYESIRVALSQDDVGLAQKSAATLATSYKDRRQIAAAALALSKADSLESARDAFSTMSVEAVKMARGDKEYYVIGCSMNQCPAPCVNCQMWRFSDWVQSDPAIANPFMGKASPRCGVIT
jgi:antitoxin component of RelBE/YafQ-DinJ toxin-antitoxin module